MTYLHCPRCRLTIKCRAHYLMLTNCPRCLARAAIASPLSASPLHPIVPRAEGRQMAPATGSSTGGDECGP